MKAKLMIVLLIGMLIGSFLGSVLVPTIRAVEYNYQLDDVTFYLHKISKSVSNIEDRVNSIYWEMD